MIETADGQETQEPTAFEPFKSTTMVYVVDGEKPTIAEVRGGVDMLYLFGMNPKVITFRSREFAPMAGETLEVKPSDFTASMRKGEATVCKIEFSERLNANEFAVTAD